MVKRKKSPSGGMWLAFLLAMALGGVGAFVAFEHAAEGILIIVTGILILIGMMIQAMSGSTKAKPEGRKEKPGFAMGIFSIVFFVGGAGLSVVAPIIGIPMLIIGIFVFLGAVGQQARGQARQSPDGTSSMEPRPDPRPEKPVTAQYKMQVNRDSDFGSYSRKTYRTYSEAYLATDRGIDTLISDLKNSVYIVLEDTPEKLRRMIRRVNRPVRDDYIRSKIAKTPEMREFVVRREAWNLMTSDQRRSWLERASFIRFRHGRI
jgi:hypothetical protein